MLGFLWDPGLVVVGGGLLEQEGIREGGGEESSKMSGGVNE